MRLRSIKLIESQNHINDLSDVRVSLLDRLADVTEERERLREILDELSTVQCGPWMERL